MRKLPKLAALFAAILLFSAAFAQPDRQWIYNYISQYKDIAISEMLRTGVPASITLAQGIHESSGGQSMLASEGNNHFGIKCNPEWKGETISHDDDAKGECFRKYSTVADSYRDHSDFLKAKPRYAFLFKLDPTDYEGWAKGLKRAGYATNPAYSSILIKIIVENNLQDYSLAALQKMQPANEPLLTSISAKGETSEELAEAPVVVPPPVIPLIKEDAKPAAKTSRYPLNSIFSINDTRVIYAEAGTSLLAVAANFNVSFSRLLEFNDMTATEILGANQLIFLQKKQKRGSRDIHVVEDNETLHEISQKEGIQLAAIMELNGLKPNMQPAKGEKIYLKNPAPSTPRLAIAGKLQQPASM